MTNKLLFKNNLECQLAMDLLAQHNLNFALEEDSE